MNIDARLYQSDLIVLRALCLGEKPSKDTASQLENLASILDDLCGQRHAVIVAFAPDDGE